MCDLAPFQIPILPFTNDPSVRCRQIWTLDELVVGNNDSENNPPLLPRLNSLLLSSRTPWISDDTLVDLIRSRMTASPQTAALEQVKGIFYRERSQRDVVKEIAQHAELLGVEMIDLDLIYGQQQPRPLDVDSPAFGLGQFDAPSWTHEDAGEMAYRWCGSRSGRTTVLAGF